MKTLVVYLSETGFTKQYVDMLTSKLVNPEIVEIKDLKKSMIKEADIIFYGGPLRNNVIRGLDKFLKFHELFDGKEVLIFATGIQPIDDDKKQNVIDSNGLNLYHVRLYLLPGGLDISKMGAMKQKMIKFGLKQAFKSGKMPEGVTEEMIEQRFAYPINLVTPNAIERMIYVYNVLVSRRSN